MEKIGLVYDFNKKEAEALALKIKQKLEKHSFKVVVNEIAKDQDLIVTFGGDGFVLHISNEISKMNLSIPLVRVNFGRRGFLANINSDDLPFFLEKIVQKKYIINKRKRISAIYRDRKFDALNDLVLERIGTKPIELEVLVGDKRFKRRGDGIIFSTRTGSSAYNRSAGGPILNNEDFFALTVVCPTESEEQSSFINESNALIKVKLLSKDGARLVADGIEVMRLERYEQLIVQESSNPTHFVEFEDV